MDFGNIPDPDEIKRMVGLRDIGQPGLPRAEPELFNAYQRNVLESLEGINVKLAYLVNMVSNHLLGFTGPAAVKPQLTQEERDEQVAKAREIMKKMVEKEEEEIQKILAKRKADGIPNDGDAVTAADIEEWSKGQ